MWVPSAISAGSSPLARGLRPPRGLLLYVGGIIPARAGFTSSCSTAGSPTQDHPRSRGVYTKAAFPRLRVYGSSPLARGLHGQDLSAQRVGRIIPARAGFTRRGAAAPARRRDHPRSRGVYGPSPQPREPGSGSSPLARGLLYRAWAAETHAGIIPARAGFTGLGGIPGGESRDHPRSRGVYSPGRPSAATAPGSSPLARGLRGGQGPGPHHRRIIPARAGFTWRRGR